MIETVANLIRSGELLKLADFPDIKYWEKIL